MRRLLSVVAVVMCFGCGADLLPPVITVDGQWTGIQNGYSVSFNMVQTGSDVSGIGAIGGIGGSGEGTLTGTFIYPDLKVTLTIPGLDPVVYTGTMSQAAAKITGKLNGSGLTNLQIDVAKK